jgi:NADH:ubiquinone oxidoreductase subunit 3 (subunit A)
LSTEFAQQSLDILRDESHFQWYLIPLLAIVLNIEVRFMFSIAGNAWAGFNQDVNRIQA